MRQGLCGVTAPEQQGDATLWQEQCSGHTCKSVTVTTLILDFTISRLALMKYLTAYKCTEQIYMEATRMKNPIFISKLITFGFKFVLLKLAQIINKLNKNVYTRQV